MHQELVSAAPSDQLADGNVTEAPPNKILRQAAHERRVAERYSTDWAEDRASTMEVSQAEDTTSKALSGSIHLVGKCPLVVHMYREHFLKKYHSSPSTLHMDATGSVTKQVGKRPYMYAVIAESENGSYPLAHLAESHTVPTIMHLLTQLRRDFKLVTKIPLSPPRIVTDFSWAMLHAASEGLVKTSLHAYLKACWETTTADFSPPDTLISLCGAHISHRLSHDIKGKGVKKDAAGGFMWLFARMQKASSLATLDQHFGTFCVLALSKQQPSLQVECLMPKEPSDAQMLIDDTETAAEGTYRTQSAFGRHFDRVAKNAQEVVEDAPCVTSVFYCPSLVQYMLTSDHHHATGPSLESTHHQDSRFERSCRGSHASRQEAAAARTHAPAWPACV